jgi:hypothetical protein
MSRQLNAVVFQVDQLRRIGILEGRPFERAILLLSYRGKPHVPDLPEKNFPSPSTFCLFWQREPCYWKPMNVRFSGLHNVFRSERGRFTLLFLIALLALPGQFLSLAADLYVSPLGGSVPPFVDWTSAATNIQDAIEAASAGDVVWVTNGVYAVGGKAMAGTLTNVIVLDKALRVQSLNGPSVTRIVGKSQCRCAWLTNGAVLSGFTLRWGSTQHSGDITALQSGGGVWCSGPSATVTNCYILRTP